MSISAQMAQNLDYLIKDPFLLLLSMVNAKYSMVSNHSFK